MKSMLIIGMGKFGHHLCEYLLEQKNEIMVVDWKEENVSDMVYKVTNVQIGDCTDPNVIKSLGVSNFDMVFVCIGHDFQSSLEVTDLVKNMGAKYVVSRAIRDVQKRFLLKNGADEVIYPDRDIAERIAKRASADNVFDYIELDEEHSIYEITVPKKWIGKSIKELQIRKKYNVSIFSIKRGEKKNIIPDPDYIMTQEDHLMILGATKDVEPLL